MSRTKRSRGPFALVLGLILLGTTAALQVAHAANAPVTAESGANQAAIPNTARGLSPFWKTGLQQWGALIIRTADKYGMDADFVAAVVREESNGVSSVVSRVGAVGLMGVMPAGPGLEWRPKEEALLDPATNLDWGVAILAEIVRQSGGDLYSALAAYSGGWEQVNSTVPRSYAASVLDNYGRAVATRSGITPDIASQWTMAIELRRGYVPNEELLVLGDQPVSGLIVYGEHIIYNYVDQGGRSYYVRGYAVPVALVVPIGTDTVSFGSADALDLELQARLGEADVKIPNSNLRILIACLPSLSRLRGHVSTRWFAPSDCPNWHR